MTLASQMLSDVSSVFLNTDEHAAAYAYTKRSGSTGTVDGVWELDEVPNLELTRGEENCHTGKLHVAATTTLKRDDVVTINSQAWTIAGVGAVNAGMQTITLKRQDVASRNVGML